VHTLFALVGPTMHVHLALLARLAAALRDADFRAAVQRRAGAEELLAQADRVEAKLRGAAAAKP
jgi:PTS system nitrogen regulatory IIA component